MQHSQAALLAMEQIFEQKGQTVPIIITATIVDGSGTLISGHTIAEFYQKLSYVRPLSIGFNIKFGYFMAKQV